ncbi:hypothetical protein HPP92_020623 [Vanilla planifolia]|uniref:Protein kinase domain-containing protein n=1 Tax=Vanilla planifolia TaxID=51239 RepID=A0A835Q6C6_VANPL|nr:hypothetical protein HPP92_020623 [Vanilla planifolia]
MDLPRAVGVTSVAIILFTVLASFVCILLLRRRSIRCVFPSPFFLRSDDLQLCTTTLRVTDGPEIDLAESPASNKAAVALYPRRFTWPEVVSATCNFSSPVIGRGGFSTVYLARLPDSSLAAVKLHYSNNSERLHRAYYDELDILLHLEHPHIVRLLGYCDDKEDQGVLLFEHVPNGTLHEKLHNTESSENALPWPRRISIACRLAQALDYLHEGSELQIVHGDVKADNILLDEGLNPKLTDFGCSRMGFSSAIARPPLAMTGSPGYVDPHYIRTGMVSKKSDVYSFGVLLLELVTGREAFDLETERKLTIEVGPMLLEATEERATEIVDPRVAAECDVREAAAMASLAVLCLAENPSVRPSMAEVVRALTEQQSSAKRLAVKS